MYKNIKNINGEDEKINTNQSEEIRKSIENRIERYELLEIFEEIRIRSKNRRVSTDSTILIREDWDSK